MEPTEIDLDNPRSVEEIQQDLDDIPLYWGFGFFGERALLLMEMSAALAEQDRDEWGELDEQYPELAEDLSGSHEKSGM